MTTIRTMIFILCLLMAGCVETASNQVDVTQRSPKTQAELKTKLKSKALEIVNERMEAYNAHDIDRFMDLYSEDIEIFTYPYHSLGKGKDHLRSLFEPLFKDRNVSVEIHGQFLKDSYVVNHETVNYGNSKTEYVSVYEVRDGLIQSVRFIRD